jgi:hypothetical protein
MSKPRSQIHSHAPVAALRPSEYTSALVQVLRARAACVRGADALEIGSGSGVVLAALGALGAASLFGIDIENEAVAAGTLLLRELGYGNAQFHQGDMWQPVAGCRFNVIAANLPQFPRMCGGFLDRLPSWSSGGPDGRSLLDPLPEGHGAPRARRPRAAPPTTPSSTSTVALDHRAMRPVAADAVTTLVYIASEKLT